jgi:ribosomal protein L37AE/L43A
MTCPHCGRSLLPVTRPETAPWLCLECHRGWWSAELTVAAKDAYRPEYRDFGYGQTARLIAETAAEEQHG